MFAEQVAHEAPQPDPAAAGWTEIGKAISTDFAPQIAYLTKSCTRCDVEPFRSSAECNGCRSDAGLAYKNVPPGNLPPRDDDGTEVPGRYRTGGSPWLQRPQSAYERKTMCTNYGIGYGYSQPQCFCEPATQNGMRYGVLHAGGCKDNRCNQDPFYHPAVKAVTAPIREFRLYARASDCGTSRFQYAVAPCNTHSPLLVTLPSDPRQPPWSSCSSVGFARQAYLQLVGGDRIYIPGMPGSFLCICLSTTLLGRTGQTSRFFAATRQCAVYAANHLRQTADCATLRLCRVLMGCCVRFRIGTAHFLRTPHSNNDFFYQLFWWLPDLLCIALAC